MSLLYLSEIPKGPPPSLLPCVAGGTKCAILIIVVWNAITPMNLFFQKQSLEAFSLTNQQTAYTMASMGLGKSRNLKAGTGTVKLGMRLLAMLFSQTGKTRKSRWKLVVIWKHVVSCRAAPNQVQVIFKLFPFIFYLFIYLFSNYSI